MHKAKDSTGMATACMVLSRSENASAGLSPTDIVCFRERCPSPWFKSTSSLFLRDLPADRTIGQMLRQGRSV